MFYTYLDHLPQLPDELVKLALEQAEHFRNAPQDEKKSMDYNSRNPPDPSRPRFKKKGDEILFFRPQPRIDISNLIGDWVNQNISKEWQSILVAQNLNAFQNSFAHSSVLHTDQNRSYLLLYLLYKSNPVQETVFFQEHGRPLHRKRYTMVDDYAKIKEVCRVNYPLHRWVFMDSTIIHDIEFVEENRIAIHVGFDIDPFGVTDWEDSYDQVL